MGYNEWVHNTNIAVARSFVGRRFRLEGSGHPKERKGSHFFTELRAGLATFFAMAYIISVNATIVSQSGGTCVCPPDSPDLCDSDTDYMICVAEVQRDLITATAAISALTTFCMGLFANMPIALAPGMGLNAYFAYTVVGYHGSGLVPYSVAVTAVFVEGFVFVGLTILGLRQWLARAIPASIKLATGVGIGLYLTLIGLTYNAGIGAISGDSSDPLALAGCHPANRDEFGVCPSWDKMRNPTMWVGIFCGGILTVMLMLYRVKGAIILGILLVSIISWPRGTPVTYFPYTDLGDSNFDFFKKVVTFHPIGRILTAQAWDVGSYGGQFGLAFITFLYVDILDATGTLYSMARFCGAIDEKTQDFEGSAVAYLVDAFGISIGALMGTPPVTAYIESGAGISEGGATGLTAMTTGLCFFISIFFAPIFASIPSYATGCTLIIVGSLMAKSAADINWRYIGDAIPAFLTIAIMPFTYSIAYGLIAGIISYMIINTTVWLIEIATGGRIKPPEKEYKDPWTYKIEGGILPPWLVRASKGKKDFWRPYDDLEHNDPVATNAAINTATGTTLEGREHPDITGTTNVHHATTTSDYDLKGGTTGAGAFRSGSGSASTSDAGEKVKG
ncbi:MFS transporter, AGZA family, xanthine/uracil permease [Capronia coronata CBS 617.96]|uniref:MFS transporter, AGZA family, xanthine/uracil permease n=1 Tax=Capronia coronata CBS 617.96 TaxID=1182541 RepID=W9Y5P4_9EURO|nr:MFS transporter, AGZA family, xanthine/uracil permease [Capronia coronata CBS 617.96]EXJ88152.1 MFS transporter, AGZA family, xanthine/uracil permease [Capronia coronata CBS 617.96]